MKQMTLLASTICAIMTLFTSCTSNLYETKAYHYHYNYPTEQPVGKSYEDSKNVALDVKNIMAGKWERGSEEWQEACDDWLNDPDPGPWDLDDIDGSGFEDSRDAALDNC